MSFASLGLSEALASAVEAAGYTSLLPCNSGPFPPCCKAVT